MVHKVIARSLKTLPDKHWFDGLVVARSHLTFYFFLSSSQICDRSAVILASGKSAYSVILYFRLKTWLRYLMSCDLTHPIETPGNCLCFFQPASLVSLPLAPKRLAHRLSSPYARVSKMSVSIVTLELDFREWDVGSCA